MQDSVSKATAAHDSGAMGRAAGEPPKLAFAESDSASKWFKSLPLLPVPQAYAALMGQLGAIVARSRGEKCADAIAPNCPINAA